MCWENVNIYKVFKKYLNDPLWCFNISIDNLVRKLNFIVRLMAKRLSAWDRAVYKKQRKIALRLPIEKSPDFYKTSGLRLTRLQTYYKVKWLYIYNVC